MVSAQSVIGPQSVLGPQSVIGPPCPASRVVIPAIPDGRFFHSVVISTNPALQTTVRGFTGFLSNQMLQITERWRKIGKCACTAPSQQIVPAPPPHSKVCLHHPLTAKCACTAPSQRSVPAPPPHNKVCLHRPLTATPISFTWQVSEMSEQSSQIKETRTKKRERKSCNQ